MQFVIITYILLIVVVLFVAMMPFVVMGIASKKTREFRMKFEKGEVSLDPSLLPSLVILHGRIMKSRRNILVAYLLSLAYCVSIYALVVVFMFGLDFSMSTSNVVVISVLTILLIVSVRPDSTGGLGESWQSGLDKLNEMQSGSRY